MNTRIQDLALEASVKYVASGVWTPNMRWYANDSKFLFREERDLEWFCLRWS